MNNFQAARGALEVAQGGLAVWLHATYVDKVLRQLGEHWSSLRERWPCGRMQHTMIKSPGSSGSAGGCSGSASRVFAQVQHTIKKSPGRMGGAGGRSGSASGMLARVRQTMKSPLAAQGALEVAQGALAV